MYINPQHETLPYDTVLHYLHVVVFITLLSVYVKCAITLYVNYTNNASIAL